MKILTETRDGGRIVEMSALEMSMFRRLVMSVEGRAMPELYNGGLSDNWHRFDSEDHADLSTTFKVIAEWIEQKCNLNEMERAVKGFRKAIGETER